MLPLLIGFYYLFILVSFVVTFWFKNFFAVNLFHSILISGVSDFVVFAVISSLPLLRIMLRCKLKFLTVLIEYTFLRY